MNGSLAITKRMDSLPFSNWHVGMITAIGTIWIFDGYQVSLVSLFSKYILESHTESQYKALATMYQLGCIIGSVCFGIFAYFYGRRAVFMITLLIYAVGVIFCLSGNIFTLFLLGRFLTGISVGGQFTAIFTAVDEFLPPKVRGRVDIAIDGTWHLGACLASILNLAIGEMQEWKLLFAVGFFGVLGLACIRRSIPESPRWLIMKGRHSQANQVVSGIQSSALNGNYFFTPQNSNIQSKQPGSQSNRRMEPHPQKIQIKSVQQKLDEPELVQIQFDNIDILKGQPVRNNILQQMKLIAQQYKIRLSVSCFLIYVQAFFFSSVYYQFPVLLQKSFNFSQRQISGYMLGLSVCSFVSTLIVGPFFDIVGRQKMLLITYGVTGILLPFSNILNTNPVHLQIITCLMFVFGSPASSSANLVASQLFPTSTRPIVLSLIFVIGMFGGMCGVWVNNYYVSGALMLIAGILGFFLCPKAENKSLEEINILHHQ